MSRKDVPVGRENLSYRQTGKGDIRCATAVRYCYTKDKDGKNCRPSSSPTPPSLYPSYSLD
jgi:hypothetical protein